MKVFVCRVGCFYFILFTDFRTLAKIATYRSLRTNFNLKKLVQTIPDFEMHHLLSLFLRFQTLLVYLAELGGYLIVLAACVCAFSKIDTV